MKTVRKLALFILGIGLGLTASMSNSVNAGDGGGCDLACCDAAVCDCLNGCDTMCSDVCAKDLGLGKLLDGSWIKPSDHCFDDFISPMINFVHFEDPRTLTELRPIFLNHRVPNTIGNNIPAGGDIQLYAAQFRIALTDRISLIGVKDGYIVDNTGGALDGLLDDGWAAITPGLKVNLIRDTQAGTLFSVGGTYELPIGSQRALQDVGNGEFHLFATGGQRLLCGNAHVMSAFGWRVPADGFAQSESIHWSNHFDVRLTEKIYLLTEVAWWHWVDSAGGGLGPLGVAGQDLFNLSTTDVTGNDLVTQNIGAKWKPCGNAELGLAYEFPLTDFKDVIEGRIQAEMIMRY